MVSRTQRSSKAKEPPFHVHRAGGRRGRRRVPGEMSLEWLRRHGSNRRRRPPPRPHNASAALPPRRRLSLGEYKRTASWSKYLVSSGGRIKWEEEQEEEEEEEEEWSADMSELYIGSMFASGRHSHVYYGVYKQSQVAVKIVSQPEEDPALAAALEAQFTSEVSLLLRLRHPNIVTFVAACKKPPVFCIITEYMTGGSLRKYLNKQKPHSVPLNLVLKLAIDIARGMKCLHAKGILHRDLKSENLLLGNDMSVKVADFGISCLESKSGSPKGFTGTYRWMAPEMIKEKQHTKKVDVYSFAIVLWEILTALTPFQGMTPEQAAFAVAQKNARPTLPALCPPAFGHLITWCWSSDPRKRPHFHEIEAILESYAEALEEDPDFFYRCEPPQHQGPTLRLPSCIDFCMSP